MLGKSKAAAMIAASIIGMAGNVQAVQYKEPTLKQKIGQMIMIGFNGMSVKPSDPVAQAIIKHEIGGVVLFDYDYPSKTYHRNIESPQQVKQLTAQLQRYTEQAAKDSHQAYVPLLIGIDYEGGKVNRLKENYGFPKTVSAEDFAKLSPQQATAMADTMAKTLQDAGINLDFAPDVDVNINPDNPIIGKYGRSFSADPAEVAKNAAVFANAFQEHGVLCSYKHFPGHGSSTGDTHKGFVDVTETWQDSELDPYRQLLNQPQSCGMVMVAHVVHYGLDSNGRPASISKPIIQDLLREKLQFNGVVITDDMQMGAITSMYGLHEAVRSSINAGADILVFGNMLSDGMQDPAELVEMIYQDVQSGKIRKSRIDEAYQRIVQLKQKLKKNQPALTNP